MPAQFYTYLHCKPDGSPFYVGKGSGTRSHNFENGRNVHHKNIVKKYGIKNIEVLVFKKDSEESAFKSEVRLIKMLRAAGFVLTNKTDGGEGASGNKHSAEICAKISAAAMGHQRNLGKKHSLETCAKHSAASSKQKHSDTTRAKLSIIARGNKNSLGCKRSAETKEKLSLLAKARWQNADYRMKLSDAPRGNKFRLGKCHTEETKIKIGAKNSVALMGNKNLLGHKHTDKTREQISESLRAAHHRKANVNSAA